MKIGIVVAVEFEAINIVLGEPTSTMQLCNQEVSVYKRQAHELYLYRSGPGEIAATIASECKVDIIMNYGIVGGLSEEMKIQSICIVDKVVHYDFDTSQIDNVEIGRYSDYPSIYLYPSRTLIQIAKEVEPRLYEATCASGDKFVGSMEKKNELRETFSADICEMEAAGILLTCHKNKIPSLFIKVVSDGLTGDANEYWSEKKSTSVLALEVLLKIIDQLTESSFDTGFEA